MAEAAEKRDSAAMSEGRADHIDIRDVTVTYGLGGGEAVTALQNIDLKVAEGEFVALVGPSGCGKSTLLKTVGDLLTPTSGRITVGGHDTGRLRREGRIGMVFQQANLMPWLRIDRNVRLLWDLRRGRGAGAQAQEPDVEGLLDTVGLTGFGGKRPHQLSGGMQQRAALARALALDPALLLMDEPFAALDEITRDRMGLELLRIWTEYRKTVLFVTHSLAEAVFLADRVVLMTTRPGRIHRIYEINLPRPRDHAIRLEDDFMALVGGINRDLYRMMMQ